MILKKEMSFQLIGHTLLKYLFFIWTCYVLTVFIFKPNIIVINIISQNTVIQMLVSHRKLFQ